MGKRPVIHGLSCITGRGEKAKPVSVQGSRERNLAHGDVTRTDNPLRKQVVVDALNHQAANNLVAAAKVKGENSAGSSPPGAYSNSDSTSF
jgi:hypothetical protein